MDELLSVCCEDLVEDRPSYNGTTLYIYNNCTNSPYMYTNEAATQQYDVNEAGLWHIT